MVSCSGRKEKVLDYEERELSNIYNKALDKLLEKNYTEAALEFEEVERQHPYSKWSKKSILALFHMLLVLKTHFLRGTSLR